MARTKSNYNTKYYVDYIWKRLNKKYGLTYPQISAIIKGYHQLAREDLALGEPVYLKNRLGNLRLTKEKREIRVDEEGNIINNLPINLPETLKLWKAKPELKQKKFIRFINKHSDGYLFRLSYQISKANYKYKNIYNFRYNATLKKKLHKNIIDKKVEAYINRY